MYSSPQKATKKRGNIKWISYVESRHCLSLLQSNEGPTKPAAPRGFPPPAGLCVGLKSFWQQPTSFLLSMKLDERGHCWRFWCCGCSLQGRNQSTRERWSVLEGDSCSCSGFSQSLNVLRDSPSPFLSPHPLSFTSPGDCDWLERQDAAALDVSE